MKARCGFAALHLEVELFDEVVRLSVCRPKSVELQLL